MSVSSSRTRSLTHLLSLKNQTLVEEKLHNTSDRGLEGGEDPSVIDGSMLADAARVSENRGGCTHKMWFEWVLWYSGMYFSCWPV
jgi:hypothetical protein